MHPLVLFTRSLLILFPVVVKKWLVKLANSIKEKSYLTNGLKKKIRLGTVDVELTQVGRRVLLVGLGKRTFIVNQELKTTAGILALNFTIVKEYFHNNRNAFDDNAITINDLDKISFLVVKEYLFMYNLWRNGYKKHKPKSLIFNPNDLRSVRTFTVVLSYLKTIYPDWQEKTMAFLSITKEEFIRRDTSRALTTNK